MNRPKPPEPKPAQIVPVSRPRLGLRPLAFLKLTYLCHAADTEIGGFGLSSETDPLVIEDVLVVKQTCTAVTVEFDDAAVADLIDAMADRSVAPNRCCRVWVHTHPGHSASPSGTDERTFARSFGGADFSVMLILARGGAMYARLQLIGSVKTAIEIPVVVDWSELPRWMDEAGDTMPVLLQQWAGELAELVSKPAPQPFLALADGREDRLLIGSQPTPYSSNWWDHYDTEDDLLAIGDEEERDERDYFF